MRNYSNSSWEGKDLFFHGRSCLHRHFGHFSPSFQCRFFSFLLQTLWTPDTDSHRILYWTKGLLLDLLGPQILTFIVIFYWKCVLQFPAPHTSAYRDWVSLNSQYRQGAATIEISSMLRVSFPTHLQEELTECSPFFHGHHDPRSKFQTLPWSRGTLCLNNFYRICVKSRKSGHFRYLESSYHGENHNKNIFLSVD